MRAFYLDPLVAHLVFCFFFPSSATPSHFSLRVEKGCLVVCMFSLPGCIISSLFFVCVYRSALYIILEDTLIAAEWGVTYSVTSICESLQAVMPLSGRALQGNCIWSSLLGLYFQWNSKTLPRYLAGNSVCNCSNKCARMYFLGLSAMYQN